MNNITNVGGEYVSNRSAVEPAEWASGKTIRTHTAQSDGGMKDTAHLSNTANALSAAAGATGDVHAGKVKALREAVQAGTYNVPAEAVADAVLRTLLP